MSDSNKKLELDKLLKEIEDGQRQPLSQSTRVSKTEREIRRDTQRNITLQDKQNLLDSDGKEGDIKLVFDRGLYLAVKFGTKWYKVKLDESVQKSSTPKHAWEILPEQYSAAVDGSIITTENGAPKLLEPTNLKLEKVSKSPAKVVVAATADSSNNRAGLKFMIGDYRFWFKSITGVPVGQFTMSSNPASGDWVELSDGLTLRKYVFKTFPVDIEDSDENLRPVIIEASNTLTIDSLASVINDDVTFYMTASRSGNNLLLQNTLDTIQLNDENQGTRGNVDIDYSSSQISSVSGMASGAVTGSTPTASADYRVVCGSIRTNDTAATIASKVAMAINDLDTNLVGEHGTISSIAISGGGSNYHKFHATYPYISWDKPGTNAGIQQQSADYTGQDDWTSTTFYADTSKHGSSILRVVGGHHYDGGEYFHVGDEEIRLLEQNIIHAEVSMDDEEVADIAALIADDGPLAKEFGGPVMFNGFTFKMSEDNDTTDNSLQAMLTASPYTNRTISNCVFVILSHGNDTDFDVYLSYVIPQQPTAAASGAADEIISHWLVQRGQKGTTAANITDGAMVTRKSGVIQITAGGGSGGQAAYTTNSSGVITGVTISDPGSGYISTPTLTMSMAGGSSASLTVSTLTAGSVSVHDRFGNTTLSSNNDDSAVSSLTATAGVASSMKYAAVDGDDFIHPGNIKLSSGKVLIGQSTSKSAEKSVSGDITVDTEGAMTIGSEKVDEGKLHISNAGSNGQFLSKQSGDNGGLTWATPSGGASALNDLSDVTYSSGDLTISSLDKIISGNLELDSSGSITLESETDIVKVTCSGTEQARFSATGLNIAQGQKIALDGTTTEDYIYGDGTDVFIALGDSDITTFKETQTLSEVPLKIREAANAVADSAAYGQLWIKNSTPNELAFTDDAGTDITGIGKYQYETKISNFYSTATGNFIPLPGYVIERTSDTGMNEYLAFIAPFDGILHSLHFRSEIAQDGNMRVGLREASDGTEIPGTGTGQWNQTIDVADDTTVSLDFTTLSATSGSNAITKGRLYTIKITSPSAPYDTNVTTVWKWDITS